jgi:hypothetical protein
MCFLVFLNNQLSIVIALKIHQKNNSCTLLIVILVQFKIHFAFINFNFSTPTPSFIFKLHLAIQVSLTGYIPSFKFQLEIILARFQVKVLYLTKKIGDINFSDSNI